MDDAKQQLIDKLKSSNNILVTVSRDPSVDQLASCIGLTLLLNKQGKHAAAVFSGKVPSTLEFLKPEDTLEENTDSLRDFIISLDKAKADKLRYKVEEDVVRIFITPYRTSLSEADLEFTEGDFNVDVVIALGVHQQQDLDQAITAHGRILHDATVTSINTSPDDGLGTINWYDTEASSLSELVTDLAQALEGDLLDGQIATALLTGIVSETGRFSNDKTSSQTMSASAALMAAGANQQLVATKLEGEHPIRAAAGGKAAGSPAEGEADPDDGILEIDHVETDNEEKPPAPSDTAGGDNIPEPAIKLPETPEPPAKPAMSAGPKLMTEPPTMGGTLTANSRSEQLDPVTDPFSMPSSETPRMLDHREGTSSAVEEPAVPAAQMQPAPQAWTPPSPPPPAQALHGSPIPDSKGTDDLTLSDLEQSVGSPHADKAELDTVRTEVDKALSGIESNEPIEALNARPLGTDLHPAEPLSPPAEPLAPPLEPQPTAQPLPPPDPSAPAPPPATPEAADSNAPPPVPPPIPFQFGNSPPPQ